MRDPKRIDRILEKFKEAWLASPDQRFVQLVMNITGPGDHFYLEDDKFEEKIEELEAKMFGADFARIAGLRR